MDYLLPIIGILLLLLIALLAAPLSIRFYVHSNQILQGYARFRLLFGLVKFQLHFPSQDKPVIHNKQAPTTKPKPHKTKNGSRSGILFLKQSIFRRHVINFIKDLFRATHARDLYLRLRIGLGDPADTGMLWAIMGPVSAMLKNGQGMMIEIEPEFIDAVVEIESHGNFKLIPLQFIALTIAFILSPTTLRAWRTTRQDN